MSTTIKKGPEVLKRIAEELASADCAPAPCSAQASQMRSAWLVENGKVQGHGLKYLTMRHGMFEWTEDPYLALQMSRRLDAEKIAEECEDAWRIVEHGFQEIAPNDSSSPATPEAGARREGGVQ